MSRSYKKHPFCKNFNRRKHYGKRYANKKVRTYLKSGKDLSNGMDYKKIYERWDIFEYHWYCTLSSEIFDWERDKYSWYKDMTYNEVKYEWFKMYKRK